MKTDLDLFLCHLTYSLHGTPFGAGSEGKYHARSHIYPNPLGLSWSCYTKLIRGQDRDNFLSNSITFNFFIYEL